MRPLDDCIKQEKSKADEMFEELGYSKLEEILGQDKKITYRNIRGKNIHFGTNKRLMLDGMGTYTILTFEELQAINEKVKELGWNE